MKRLAWLFTFGLLAIVIALMLAPWGVSLAVQLAQWGVPNSVAEVFAHLSYEAVLWGIGLGAFWLAQHWNWLTRLSDGVLLVLTAPLVESGMALVWGGVAPGFSSALGFGVRVVVVACVLVALVFGLRRRAHRLAPPSTS